MVKFASAHDGIDVLEQLADPSVTPKRRLFWRLQGQAALLDGAEKLVRPAHRPAELFRVGVDVGESNDLAASEPDRLRQLFEVLGKWESNLPTVPLWGSSPYWSGHTGHDYDAWPPRDEPAR